MLGKLLKHEFKYTSRIFPLIYIVLILFSAIGSLLLFISNINSNFSILFALYIMLYVAVIFAASVLSQIFLIVRFYKNIVGDEGYLTFTLPVKPYQHILAKLITATVWSVSTSIVMFASIGVILLGMANNPSFFSMAKEVIEALIKVFFEGPYRELYIVMWIVLVFVSAICSYSMLYASMSLGQLFKGHKIIGSIASYLILSVISQTFSGIASLIPSIVVASSNNTQAIAGMNLVIIALVLVIQIILSVAYFFTSNFVLTKKLNLD